MATAILAVFVLIFISASGRRAPAEENIININYRPERAYKLVIKP
jgi:hypothetical protein